MFYKDKTVLVAGGTGLIGIPTVARLVRLGAKVKVVALDPESYARRVLPAGVDFQRADLTVYANCLKAVKGADYVLNLVGIKGSVGIGQNKVASYLVPMLLFQTHLMEAAFRSQVSRFLFVGSICSYPQADRPKEEDTVWDGMPKQNDRIPGLAKRIGEIQGEAYLLEHKWEAVRIVRPANVFGPYDDFNPATAQVIPALIRRMFNGDNPVKVWGDGKAVRDFIYSEDVADGILLALEKAPPCTPLNLGSGRGVSIGELAAAIARCFDPPPALEFDAARPGGDPVRVLATRRAAALLGFQPRHALPEALAETVAWLKQNIAFVREREAIQSNA